MYPMIPSRAVAMTVATDTIDKDLRAIRRERARRLAEGRSGRTPVPTVEPAPQPVKVRAWWSAVKILRLAH